MSCHQPGVDCGAATLVRRDKNDPGAGGVPRSLVSELPAGGWGDWPDQPNVLALRNESGGLFAAIFLGPL